LQNFINRYCKTVIKDQGLLSSFFTHLSIFCIKINTKQTYETKSAAIILKLTVRERKWTSR